MDIGSISTAYTSLQLAREAITAALGMKTFNDAAGRITEAREQLLKAQDGLFIYSAKLAELQEKLRVAESELTEMKRMKLERDQYTLVQITDGIWAYRSKAVSEAGKNGLDSEQPPHYICQGCFDQGKKFVLQLVGASWQCPGCKTFFSTGEPISFRTIRDWDPT